MEKKYSAKKSINSELDLVERVVAFLQEDGYDEIKKEIPNFTKSIDIVATKNDSIFCIEVKLKNWKQAVNQTLGHRNIADFIIIAIATVNISEKYKNDAEKYGFGIIHCNPTSSECNVIITPKPNNRKWNTQQKIFKQEFLNY